MDLLGLFFWSFLAATILPLGSEPALALIVSRRDAVILPVVIATIGNYLGACTTYALARSASKAVRSERAMKRMESAASMIRRYGPPALLLSWVPLVGDAIVAAAGLARMPFVPFSPWTLTGKAARYAGLALFIHWSLQ